MILNSTTITMIVGVSIILIAIAISSDFQVQEKSFSQVITVGPVWNSDSWVCTSDADFMVYGVLRKSINTACCREDGVFRHA